jgi:pimeloyl-ACP methyl ester carboxylesterase
MRSSIGRAAFVTITLATAIGAGPSDDADRANPAAPGSPIDPSKGVGGIPSIRFEPTGLSLLRPHERGKIPVVLVHGLWATPWSWCPMVEALGADPTLSGRYQFWTFGYSTGEPILYSGLLLRRALRQAREQFDPDRSDAAFGRMVVVGHSMGGLLAKVMVQDSRSRLWESVSDRPVDRVLGPPEAREVLREAFFYERVPEVRRVVFIATPHRGSRLDQGKINRIGSRLIRHVDPLQEAYKAILASNDPDFFKEAFRSGLATSVDQLAWDHPRLVALNELGVHPSVPYHSIIADRRDPPLAGGTDGIVPYDSAHLVGALSEALVSGGHLCQADPQVIAEVRRILVEHLKP